MKEALSVLVHKIATIIAIPLVAVLNTGGYSFVEQAPPPKIIEVQAPAPALGSTFAVPDTIALFSTSLQSPITSSASSMTLASASYNGGTATLASSTYGFILDEGTALEEVITADCTSTTCTNLTRGIDRLSGSTTVATLQFAHRRGASVKITSAPSLLLINRIVQGVGTFPNKLSYTSHPTFTATTQIVDKKYVDDTAFSGAGVIDATAAARGVSELATGPEAAASTAQGSSGILVLPASLSTSTFNGATAANRIIASNGSGKIDSLFISTSTLFTNVTYATTTQIGSFPSWQIGKQISVITTTGTSTFAIPSGITKLHVRLVASGGGGDSCSANGSGGGGGGGGGYSEEYVDVTGTSTVQVYVGAAVGAETNGERTTFGTIGFHFLTATGGSLASTADGGNSGTGTGGDINLQTGIGGDGSGTTNIGISGQGGNTPFGFGGATQGGNATGNTATGYGGGGGGSSCATANPNTGGTSAQGVIVINW
jgi:hypothetical protein